MFTEEEFYAMLEEAFEAGYDDALDEVFDEAEEDSAYSLEDEMDCYGEADEYESEYEDLYSYTEARDDTKFDRIRKAAIKGDGPIAKELGFSPKTRSDFTRAYLAATGKGDGGRRAKSFAKYASRAMYDAVKDSKKVSKNLYGATVDATGRVAEMKPHLDKMDNSKKGKLLALKGKVAGRLLSKVGAKYQDIVNSFKSKKRGDGRVIDEDEWNRIQKKDIANRIKSAIDRKQRKEKWAADNRASDARWKANGMKPYYTKSGKFYRNDDGTQGKRAI